MRKNVAVFFGGRSCENEISVITGTMTANLLRGERYEVFPVYIAQNGCMYTGDLFDTATFKEADLSKKFDRASVADGKLYAVRGKKMRELCALDCALNCCHGIGGEDGAAAGLLDLNGIPNASPDMAASALFMDKVLTKLAAKALGHSVGPVFQDLRRGLQKARRHGGAVRGRAAGLSRDRKAGKAGFEHRRRGRGRPCQAGFCH